MDNRTGEVLNEKCHRFEQLYHGSVNGKQYCLGTNVAKEYMCPLVSDGRIAEMPLHPWFGQQSQCHKGGAGCACHQKQPLLGKYHLCPNQSMYSHYQEAPFQRGQFIQQPQNGNKQLPANRQPQLKPSTQPRVAGVKPSVPSSSKPEEIKQQGGYVWTVNADGLSSVNVESDDPYEKYPAQDGYYVKRCVGDRNLHPSRQFGFNEPIPTVPSKPPVPPLAVRTTIHSLKNRNPPADMAITGVGLPMNYLEVETPEETTNRYIMNYNIAPGYYPDMVYDHIGKRPVYTARNIEGDIPEIIMKNKYNLVGHDGGCRQPTWGPRCI